MTGIYTHSHYMADNVRYLAMPPHWFRGIRSECYAGTYPQGEIGGHFQPVYNRRHTILLRFVSSTEY